MELLGFYEKADTIEKIKKEKNGSLNLQWGQILQISLDDFVLSLTKNKIVK